MGAHDPGRMSYSTPTEITPVGSAEITASPVTAEAQNIALAAEQEATPTASGDADLFPLRPARDLTLKVCSSCHAPAIVAKQRLGEEEWSDLVQVMSARGAVATDKELSEILWSSIVGRLSVGYFADVFSKKSVMTATYFIVAATMLLLLHVSPKSPASLYIFAVGFGFSMGADYMLIPLMAAERFGINTLARAMSIILLSCL
jgi:hypothetical protein